MASNGYVRSVCPECIFYSDEREYGNRCNLYGESLTSSDSMKWVSATDCNRFPEIKEKHYEPCEHYTNKNDIKNQRGLTYKFKVLIPALYCKKLRYS